MHNYKQLKNLKIKNRDNLDILVDAFFIKNNVLYYYIDKETFEQELLNNQNKEEAKTKLITKIILRYINRIYNDNKELYKTGWKVNIYKDFIPILKSEKNSNFNKIFLKDFILDYIEIEKKDIVSEFNRYNSSFEYVSSGSKTKSKEQVFKELLTLRELKSSVLNVLKINKKKKKVAYKEVISEEINLAKEPINKYRKIRVVKKNVRKKQT